MQLTVNSVHFNADHKLIDFIKKKIDKLSSKNHDIIGGEVFLRLNNSSDKMNKVTEIKLKVAGHDIFAKKESDSFEAAADLAVEALRRQLNKFKKKH